MTTKVGKKLAKYDPETKVEYVQLPIWVRTALTNHYILGYTWKECAGKAGKSYATLKDYLDRSPAVKKWRAELEELVTTPKLMAENVLKANSLNISLEYLTAYEKAINSEDYMAVAKMSQDLLDRVGVVRKKEERSNDGLQVTLKINSTDIPQIEASYEEVEVIESDYEVVDE